MAEVMGTLTRQQLTEFSDLFERGNALVTLLPIAPEHIKAAIITEHKECAASMKKWLEALATSKGLELRKMHIDMVQGVIFYS